MNVTKIAYRYSRTVNLGNFESCKVECELEAELDPGDDAQACKATLAGQVKDAVREQLAPLSKLRLEQVNEIIAGLPPDMRASVKAGINGGSHAN